MLFKTDVLIKAHSYHERRRALVYVRRHASMRVNARQRASMGSQYLVHFLTRVHVENARAWYECKFCSTFVRIRR
jgi:hypothetical protein